MSVPPVSTSASSFSGASAGASAAPSALAGGSTQDRSAWPSAGAATRTPSKAAAETSRRRAITGLLLSSPRKSMIRPKVPTRAGSLSTLAYALSARQGRSTSPGGADAEGDDRHGLTGSEARVLRLQQFRVGWAQLSARF